MNYHTEFQKKQSYYFTVTKHLYTSSITIANMARTSRTRGGLEETVRQAYIPSKRSFGRAVIDWALPFFEEYDYSGEARELLKDKEIKKYGFSEEQVADYLIQSEHDYKWLVRFAQLADTADKGTSFLGMLAEASGIASVIGTPGAFAANGVEDAIEVAIFKSPFLAYLKFFDRKNSYRVNGLLQKELATMVVPIAGELYDIFRNLYVSTAHEIIREDAKAKLIADYRPERAGKSQKI